MITIACKIINFSLYLYYIMLCDLRILLILVFDDVT